VVSVGFVIFFFIKGHRPIIGLERIIIDVGRKGGEEYREFG